MPLFKKSLFFIYFKGLNFIPLTYKLSFVIKIFFLDNFEQNLIYYLHLSTFDDFFLPFVNFVK